MGMLTQARVERLMSDLSGRVRAETAAIVASEFASGHLSETDVRVAEDMIAVLARDAEIQVREAIAEHLKSCPLLPREVALELAYDIESVAVPILRFSGSLTEEDLIALVRVGPTVKQVAVAQRENLRAPVTAILVETGCSTVVEAVLENATAEISDTSFSTVVANLGHEETIQALLIERPRLPVPAIQSLIQYISDELAARLVLKHDIPAPLASQVLATGREGAFARLIADPKASSEITPAMVARLRDALSPTLLLRCLCLGNIRFVEVALATLAEIPVDNAVALISDPGPLGLQSLYRKAGLPPQLLRAFRAAVATNLEWRKQGGRPRPADLTSEILARLIPLYDEISPGNLEHVLAELDRIGCRGEPASYARALH